MKVCAHINLGPFNREHQRFDSIAKAVDYFRREVAGKDFGTGESGQALWINEQCSDCERDMNFHDYPYAVYEVGPRGGVRKEYV